METRGHFEIMMGILNIDYDRGGDNASLKNYITSAMSPIHGLGQTSHIDSL